MIQETVLTTSLLLMAILAGLFVWVAAGAGAAVTDHGSIAASAARVRNVTFGVVAIALVAINYRTLGSLPQAATFTADPPSTVIREARVTGRQWSWTIEPSTFVVGQTAEFHVTASDVNHGFALYDPDMHIVAQTQAMPTYTNVVRYTFTKPGTYQVLCLEYCGLAHHQMAAQINVTAR